MVNNWWIVAGWWLSQSLWKIMEWVRQLGWWLPFPTEWKVIKFMFQTTNQMKTLQSEKASMADWNRWRVWNWYVLFIYIYIIIYMWTIADRIERDLLSNKTLLHYRDLEQICLNKTCKMKHFMEEREREKKLGNTATPEFITWIFTWLLRWA